MNKNHPVLKRNRGRPLGSRNKQVVQRLLDVTELLLRDHSYSDLKEREIAEAAGVDNMMIHYYFGDKEGLLSSVAIVYCEEVINKLKTLATLDLKSTHVTRDICEIVLNAYYDKPWIARSVVSELVRTNSGVKNCFVKKYGKSGSSLSILQPVIESLIEIGVYDSKIKPCYAALALFSILAAPFVLNQFPGDDGDALDELLKGDWLDFVADLFDRKFRAIETKETAI